MAMKITEPFTLASVGDVIIVRPASQSTDAGVQGAIKLVRDADVGFGNFESLIRDENKFVGPLGGSMTATREVATDLKAMGFTLMNRAGNHLMDAGVEGLFETTRLMEDAGLVSAGVGRNLNEARAPRFVETPKGRIGLVELTYTMNRGDLQDNLKSITNGKQYADFKIATIHAHQSATLLQPLLFEEEPPDFLISLAHQSIDNGADAFVGHGPHILRGIEIYKGKPISTTAANSSANGTGAATAT
jgi:poly-gamma-glutamate capsule biosynthesis protein CapA/YwtB (metallophosphatase superfamily)